MGNAFNAWSLAATAAAGNNLLVDDILFAQALATDSRAASTMQRYNPHWHRWSAWCKQRGVAALPAQPIHVAAYLGNMLRYCVRDSTSFNPIKLASAAIFTAHELAGLDGKRVTSDPAVVCVRTAAARILGMGPVNTKEPLPTKLLKSAVSHCLNCNDLLTAAFMLVCFAGFLRYSDATRIPAFGARFVGDSILELWLPCRKNDQLKHGTVITISKAHNSSTCPLNTLSKYLHANPPRSDHSALFRAPGKDEPWPYDSARKSVLSAIANAVCVPVEVIQKIYGTHSLRKGGGTAASNRLPGDARTVALFLAHGGWRSKQAAAIYARPNQRNAHVANAVGL